MFINGVAINESEINGLGDNSLVIVPEVPESIASALASVVLSTIDYVPSVPDALVGAGDPEITLSTIDYIPNAGITLSAGFVGEVTLTTIDLADFIGSAVASAHDPIITLTTVDYTPEVGITTSSAFDADVMLTTLTVDPDQGITNSESFGFGLQATLEFTPVVDEVVTQANDPITLLGTLDIRPVAETGTEAIDADVQLTTVNIQVEGSEIQSTASGLGLQGDVEITEYGITLAEGIDPTFVYGQLIISAAGETNSVGISPEIVLTGVEITPYIEVHSRGILDKIRVIQTTLEFTQVVNLIANGVDPSITLSTIDQSVEGTGAEASSIVDDVIQTSIEVTEVVSVETDVSLVTLQTSLELTPSISVSVDALDPNIVLSTLYAYSEPAIAEISVLIEPVFTTIDMVVPPAQSVSEALVSQVVLTGLEFTLTAGAVTLAVDPNSIYSTVDIVPELGSANTSGFVNQYFPEYDWLSIIPRQLYQIIPTGTLPSNFSSGKHSWQGPKDIEYVYYLTSEILSLQARGYVAIKTILDIQNKASDQITDNSGGTANLSEVQPIQDFEDLRNAVSTVVQIHTDLRNLLIELSTRIADIRTQLAYVESRLYDDNDILALQIKENVS